MHADLEEVLWVTSVGLTFVVASSVGVACNTLALSKGSVAKHVLIMHCSLNSASVQTQ